MHRRRVLVAVSAGAAAALAGCTSGDTADGDSTDEETTAGMETTEETETTNGNGTADGDATVQVREVEEHGDVLVDAEGMSLYLFDQDEQGGESTCYDDCETNWPPLTIEEDPTAGADVTAELGTVERDDGSMQVTADGWPLYYYAGDSEPGDTTGQGVGDIWWLLAPDGSRIGGTDGDTTTETETASDGGGGMY